MTSTLKTRAAKTPEFKWPGVGEYGVVPIDLVRPSPYNPRKEFEAGMEELVATIKRDGQREIGTVRLLTPEEQKTAPDIRYQLTSGERRWRACQKAGLKEYEIRVKAYPSLAEEKRDAYMLNENRFPISKTHGQLLILHRISAGQHKQR